LGVAEDERNERWRRAVAFLVAGVVVAAAVGLFWIVTEGGETPTASGEETVASGEPVPWDGARRDGDRLTLYFTGARPAQADDPCSRAYEAVAEPTDDTMVVTVRPLAGSPLPPDHACTAEGYARSVTIDLPAPLRGRPIIDGASGQPRPISDVAGLLEPSWVPAGYHVSREYVWLDVDTQEWARDGHPDERLRIEQVDVDKVARPGFDPVVLDRPTVRGVPATVWKIRGVDDLVCVSWAEGSAGHRVCSSGTPGQLLPNDVLIRVADELRDSESH
jgi:hypothetical protein